MIRFIIKKVYHDELHQYHNEGHFTIDVNCPQLEEVLKSGGFGENGYEFCSLVDAEVVKNKE